MSKPKLTREELVGIRRKYCNATLNQEVDALWSRIQEDREGLFEIGEAVEILWGGSWKKAIVSAMDEKGCDWTDPKQVRRPVKLRFMTDDELRFHLSVLGVFGGERCLLKTMGRPVLDAMAAQFGVSTMVEDK